MYIKFKNESSVLEARILVTLGSSDWEVTQDQLWWGAGGGEIRDS